METPNLLKLRAKDNLDQVELCIIYWGDEVSASDDNLEEAEQAAPTTSLFAPVWRH